MSPVLTVIAAACGDARPGSSSTGPTSSEPGTTEPGAERDVRSALIRVSFEGGYVPRGFAFVNTPTLVVSGDGRAITPGASPAIYPGPLLPAMRERPISEAGIGSLLQHADDAGLLAAPPDYHSDAEQTIADAPNTVVRITVDGATFVHSAYALGNTDDSDGDETTPARRTLLAFVRSLEDLEAAAGAGTLGADRELVAEEYRLQSAPVAEAELAGLDPAPTVVDWPATSGLDLATATTCARLGVAEAGAVFVTATQNTYFRQAGILFRVFAAAVLPGDPTC